MIFVNLTAAYDTIYHRQILKKVQHLTCDSQLTNISGSMLSNCCFFVKLTAIHSHWHRQHNGLAQGSWLVLFLFNVYTNDQPMPTEICSFICANHPCLATQSHNFSKIETKLNHSLECMSSYCTVNHLHANPSKT